MECQGNRIVFQYAIFGTLFQIMSIFKSEQGSMTISRTNISVRPPGFDEDLALRNGLQVLTGGIFIYGLLRLENISKHERRLL